MTASFHYKANTFFCEDVSVASIAERFRTPTYVYSQSAIMGSFRRLAEGLRNIGALICYSVKANSSLRILRVLREAGAGFDIVAGGGRARRRRVKARADPLRG